MGVDVVRQLCEQGRHYESIKRFVYGALPLACVYYKKPMLGTVLFAFSQALFAWWDSMIDWDAMTIGKYLICKSPFTNGHYKAISAYNLGLCLYARKARFMGHDSILQLSLEENVVVAIPKFAQFLAKACRNETDVFVLEVTEDHSTVEEFGQLVRRVLTAFSTHDPAGYDCMTSRAIGDKMWYFQWSREPIFITVFSPVYPETHARHIDLDCKSMFVLFQPEIIFLNHRLTPDIPAQSTKWENPETMRDRIRVRFMKCGKPYFIPHTTRYPPARYIVPPSCPLSVMRGEFTEWWKRPQESKCLSRITQEEQVRTNEGW